MVVACVSNDTHVRAWFASSCGGRNRTYASSLQSQASLPAATTPHRFTEGRAGLEPARWYLTGTCSAAELPTQGKSALRESNPPRQVGSLEPLPLGQEHVVCRSAEGEGVEPSRLSLDRFRSGCHHPLACPSVPFQSCGGRNRTCVGRLTAACPYQHGLHRIISQDGWIRTSDLVLPTARAQCQAFPHPETKSAQRESNPHIRHGKAVGCRYIMGTCCVCQIVKDQEHRVGVEPTSPPHECGVLATRRPVQSSGTRGT